VIAPHDGLFIERPRRDGVGDHVAVQADASLDVEAVRAAGRRAMRVDAAHAFTLVEHRTDDVTREALLPLRRGEVGDTRIDLGADLGCESIEAFAEQLPLGTYELRDVREPTAARVAASTARPPLTLFRGGAGATFDVVVDGEESASHEGELFGREV
jgi:hypothetical protein